MKVSRALWLSVVPFFLVMFIGCGIPQETYDNLVQEQVALQDRLSSLEEQHTSLQGRYEEIRHQQSNLQVSYDAAILENEVQTQRENSLSERLDSLRDELESQSKRNQELETENSSLSLTIEDISNQYKQAQEEMSNLRAINASISASVSELEARLSDYYVGGFFCTGSMAPYIECGDEVVWKGTVDPTDISVRTVIGFQAPASCGSLSGKLIAHRVTEIRIVNGEPVYQTQGDNNSSPDPCWILLQNVRGVLALLREDARPEDVVDTAQYERAKQEAQNIQAQYDLYESEFRAAEASSEQAEEIYSAAYNRFANKYTQFCGFPYVPEESYRTCSLKEPWYSALTAWYDGVETTLKRLEKEKRRVIALIPDLELLASRVEAAWSEVKRLECEELGACS